MDLTKLELIVLVTIANLMIFFGWTNEGWIFTAMSCWGGLLFGVCLSADISEVPQEPKE
jgi:hypothetical protein